MTYIDISLMSKLGRNDKCLCGSNKKYKICCLFGPKYDSNNPNESSFISPYIELIQNDHPNHKVIDISHVLDSSNYMTYLKYNYNRSNILIAEKTTKNQSIFVERKSPKSDIIIMYRGGYLCLEHKNFEVSQNFIRRFIENRISTCKNCGMESDKNYVCNACNEMSCFDCVYNNPDKKIIENMWNIRCQYCLSPNGIQLYV